VLRAILIEAGIGVVPQWETTIGHVTYHPDLAGPFAGIAIEANSWQHHAGKAEHDQDCRRYNALVLGGWIVLRFTWEQVMFSPHEVVDTVRGALSLRAVPAA
jgi:very-short-patch-repair endonuclease